MNDTPSDIAEMTEADLLRALEETMRRERAFYGPGVTELRDEVARLHAALSIDTEGLLFDLETLRRCARMSPEHRGPYLRLARGLLDIAWECRQLRERLPAAEAAPGERP